MHVQVDEAWDQDLAGFELDQPTLGAELSRGPSTLVGPCVQHAADDGIPIDDDQRIRQRFNRAAFRRVQGWAKKSLVDDRLLAKVSGLCTPAVRAGKRRGLARRGHNADIRVWAPIK
jgi:hypothetical protein